MANTRKRSGILELITISVVVDVRSTTQLFENKNGHPRVKNAIFGMVEAAGIETNKIVS